MSSLNPFAIVLVLSLTVPQAAQAGLGGLLAKAASKGGKVAKVGVKAGKLGSAGKAVVGVTGLVAAERAGLLFAGLGDDAARSAAYVARTTEGELVMITRAGGQAVHTPESLAMAAGQLSLEGRPSIYLDRSAAAARDLLERLPADAQLTLVEGAQKLPVRRRGPGDFVVDTVEGAIDLGDYLGGDAEESDEGSSTFVIVLIGVGILAVILWLRSRSRVADHAPA